MTGLQTGTGTTAQRILLGSQLRRLREAGGVTREEAGYSIRASESKISRMELGRVGFKQRDVADLLTLYGVVDEAVRSSLLSLVAVTNSPAWWHVYGDAVPPWFQTYLGLEEVAGSISAYEVQFIPGLLQTEDYARAVIVLGNPGASGDDIERRVALRLRRQRLLAPDTAPELVTIVDEAALRRPCGGPEVMRRQLAYLAEVAERPRITLQVVPLGFGGVAAQSGAFTVLTFPDGELPPVVYAEQFTTALYLDRTAEVHQYTGAIERLREAALTPERTLDLLQEIAQQL